MNALESFSPEMFTALRRIGDRAVTAHEIGVNGVTLKLLAERGFLLADRDGSPPIYAVTPMGMGAIAVLTSPPAPVESEGMVQRIQRQVAYHYGIPVLEMTSNRRPKDVALARQVAYYLARELTPLSLPSIGRRFGGRDHTTVLHGIRRIAELEDTDPKIAADLDKLRTLLGAEKPAPAQEHTPQPIDRTPCFKCGVRADVGCQHTRAAA